MAVCEEPWQHQFPPLPQEEGFPGMFPGTLEEGLDSWTALSQWWGRPRCAALPAPGFLPPQLQGIGRTEQFCSCSPLSHLCSPPTSWCPQPTPAACPPALLHVIPSMHSNTSMLLELLIFSPRPSRGSFYSAVDGADGAKEFSVPGCVTTRAKQGFSQLFAARVLLPTAAWRLPAWCATSAKKA